MSVLCDWEIRLLLSCSNLVSPVSYDCINPASLDVRIGEKVMVEVDGDDSLHTIDISQYTKHKPFELCPNQFCLTETLETFNLPESISAQFVLKSSRAREGYQHALAGWCDPGWHGSKPTLELKNNKQFSRLPLYPGLRIGQMVFHSMSQIPVKSYSEVGNYNNHDRVMPSVV